MRHITAVIQTDSAVEVDDLRTNDESGLISTALPRPHLSWRLRASRDSVLQQAYELQRASDGHFTEGLISSGRIASTVPFGAGWIGGDLGSRAVVWCRVRVWTDLGVTEWSNPLRIEGSLFDQSDWTAFQLVLNPMSDKPSPGRSRCCGATGEEATARLDTTAFPIFDGASMTIADAAIGNTIGHVEFAVLPARLETTQALAEALAARGCNAQLAVLRESTAPN